MAIMYNMKKEIEVNNERMNYSTKEAKIAFHKAMMCELMEIDPSIKEAIFRNAQELGIYFYGREANYDTIKGRIPLEEVAESTLLTEKKAVALLASNVISDRGNIDKPLCNMHYFENYITIYETEEGLRFGWYASTSRTSYTFEVTHSVKYELDKISEDELANKIENSELYKKLADIGYKKSYMYEV